MIKDYPALFQGITISAVFLLVKSFIALGTGMGWWVLTDDQTKLWLNFIELGLPIATAVVTTWITIKYTTPLNKPRDVDGAILSRPNDEPAKEEFKSAQTEAIKIDKEKTRGLD